MWGSVATNDIRKKCLGKSLNLKESRLIHVFGERICVGSCGYKQYKNNSSGKSLNPKESRLIHRLEVRHTMAIRPFLKKFRLILKLYLFHTFLLQMVIFDKI